MADLRNLTLIFDAIVILISDPKGPVPQNCGIMTIMTPGETGGYEEVLVLRAPKAAIQYSFAAFGALMNNIPPHPPVSPGVIVV